MPFEIIRDDITRVAADAIVNTANPLPIIGAGTDTAIHRAAGPKLLLARQKIGAIPVGTVRETPAFDLPAKYVLHAVTPAWEGGENGEEALLHSAYDEALQLAMRLQCRSVAFPLLSAGSYGFPQERALSVAIGAFTDFLLKNDLDVKLVVFGQDAFAASKGLYKDLRSYIDDRYVETAEKTEYGRPFSDRIRRRSEPEPGFAAPMQNAPMENARFPKAAAFDRRAKAAAFDRPAKAAYSEEADAPTFGAAPDLETLLKSAESTFSEHVLDLLKERDEKDPDVYRRAEISRQLFHKIISNKDYQPTKSTAIQLAIGLRLDLTETQKLLKKAGYALTRSSKMDLVVQYFIEHGEYSIVAVNLALYDCGLPLLKTGSIC
mgnify:CR=1 FL=1